LFAAHFALRVRRPDDVGGGLCGGLKPLLTFLEARVNLPEFLSAFIDEMFQICISAAFRSVISARNCAGLGSVTTCGSSRNGRKAVGTDASAVSAFTTPSRRYMGCHSVQTLNTCVAPQARMNTPKSMNIHENAKSSLRRTSITSVNGIRK
jgi:hypothetical protein